jgi:acyl carrier protein
MNKNEVLDGVREFIIQRLFKGNVPKDFTNDTPLVSTRLMDSLNVLSMITFLEKEFNVEFEAHEVTVDNLDSINIISDFVFQKLSK